MVFRLICLVGLLSLGLGATLVFAVVEPRERNARLLDAVEMEPYGTRTLAPYILVGKQPAEVVWVGNRSALAYLGLYVYDANGNCVAWDDLITAVRARDDAQPNAVAVQWVPAETGPHTVELVNLSGFATDKTEFTVK